ISDELRESECERCCVRAWQLTKASRECWVHFCLVRRRHLGNEQQHPIEHHVEVNALAEPLTERVMHHSDCTHSPHRVIEGISRFLRMRTTRLNSQQRSNGLQIV